MDIKQEIKKRKELIQQLVKSGIPTMDEAIGKLNEEIADLQDELNNYAPSTPSELITFLKENVSSEDWMEIEWEKVDIGGLQYEHVFTKGGGEGDGEEYYVVVHFLDPDCYVRVDGWYASYDGGCLDGEPYLVQPEQKVITVYEKRI